MKAGLMAQLLAVAVGLGSLAVYFAAFFYPQIHRKPDFIWSGVGLFYAVVLWFCAGRISGALLLGQGASVALIGGLAWQLGRLRLQSGAPGLAPPVAPTPAKAQPTPAARVGKWAKSSGAVPSGSEASGSEVSGSGLSGTIARAEQPGFPPMTPSTVRQKRDRTPAYEFIDDTPTRPRRSQSVVLDSTETEPSPRVDAEKTRFGKMRSGRSSGRSEKVRSQPTIPSSGPNTPPDTTANSATPKSPAPRPGKSPLTQVKVITGWLGDVAKSFRKPKPSYPTIVIPPRPPSIPTASPPPTSPSPLPKDEPE